jgi:hypothetical protein
LEPETYHLYRGADLLGTVVLKAELCAFPWYGGQFKATPAFAAVEALFREESRLLEADQMDGWEELWAQIEEPGLKLLPADGSEAIVDLLIHIEGEEARWRF